MGSLKTLQLCVCLLFWGSGIEARSARRGNWTTRPAKLARAELSCPKSLSLIYFVKTEKHPKWDKHKIPLHDMSTRLWTQRWLKNWRFCQNASWVLLATTTRFEEAVRLSESVWAIGAVNLPLALPDLLAQLVLPTWLAAALFSSHEWSALFDPDGRTNYVPMETTLEPLNSISCSWDTRCFSHFWWDHLRKIWGGTSLSFAI